MSTASEIRARLDHLTEELEDTKKMLMHLETHGGRTSRAAWADFTAAAHEVSRRWQGPGAVAEIAAQRGE